MTFIYDVILKRHRPSSRPCMASVGNFSRTREDAVRKWNRRVADER